MRRFLKHLGIFIGPLILCFALGEYKLRTSTSHYYEVKYLQENKKDIECLIFGTSHNWRAINPEFLTMNTATLANIGSAINIDFLLFNKYIDQIASLKAIIFEVSAHSLDDLKDEDWNKNHLLNLYHDINNFDSRVPFNKHFLLTASFKNYLPKLLTANASVNQYGYMHRNESTIEFDEEGELITTKEIKTKLKNQVKKQNRKNYLQNIDKFHQVIQKCLDENIKVILLSPPKYATFNDVETQSKIRRDSFFEYYRTTPNVYIWNEERTFENESDLFYDINHLNTKGGTKFSKRVDSLFNVHIY